MPSAQTSTPQSEPSPQARRIRRPSWIDARLLIGIGLVLASIVLGARVVAAADHTYEAVAITHDTGEGAILGAADVRVARVRLPDQGLYLARAEAVVGQQLSRPLTRGELVPRSALGIPPALTLIEVPLPAASAPPLAAGQRIALWLSSATCPPVLVLSAVTVQHVRDPGTDTFGGGAAGGAGQAIDISVAPALADRLVTALSRDRAQLRAGVLSGAAAVAGEVPLGSLDCPGAGPGP
ncbi:MAG TPA: SAF domain-containing protein [Jatrophihabitantaceae bacterium]|nr:SAF domain-containing protein [Jatrophihabitantaceae bacterium]